MSVPINPLIDGTLQSICFQHRFKTFMLSPGSCMSDDRPSISSLLNLLASAAASEGSVRKVRALLISGADTRAKDHFGWTGTS